MVHTYTSLHISLFSIDLGTYLSSNFICYVLYTNVWKKNEFIVNILCFDDIDDFFT